MSAKSTPRPSIPESSSQPDISAAVQELLELRKEKEKYRELQALLRQGLENFKRQQEQAEMAEAEYRQVLKDTANISADVDLFFDKLHDAYNRYVRYLRTPYTLHMKKREKLQYVDSKYEEWLGESIRHHEEAIRILQKTLDALQETEGQQRTEDNQKTPVFGGFRLGKSDIKDIVPVDDPTLIGT